MSFNPNVPQPGDFLSDSQGDLLQNMGALDTSFGVDHYAFSNVTADNGKHNQVTTPKVINNPPTPDGHPNTTALELKFYAMEDTANLGLLQYSRGWDAVDSVSAVPCPVTYVQSPNTAQPLPNITNSVINILDFTGITQYAIGKIIIYNRQASPQNYMMEKTFGWNGSASAMTFSEVFDTFPTDVVLEMNANQMRIRKTNTTSSALTSIYWSIQFYRIVV